MSKPDTIPDVLKLVTDQNPKTILEVGVGDGFYGMLFRRYLDGDVTNNKGGFHEPDKWKHRIDGIEIFEYYRTPVHDYVYNQIWWRMDAVEFFKNEYTEQTYDLIFMGDVIEHIDKAVGMRMIRMARSYLNPKGMIIIVTPLKKSQWNESPNNNPYEKHLSLWNSYDFDFVEGYKTLNNGEKVKLIVRLQRLD